MSRFSERPRVRTAVYLGQNRLTEAGVVLTTSAAVTLIAFWIYLIVQARPVHPYTGIVFFLILPGIFVLGLVLIPIGIWQRFRKLRAKGELPAEYPKVDLRSPFLRRAVVLVGALTFANFAIMGAASYKGVEYMDSAQFCGQTCHTVMEPEYAAYVDSPHSRVSCVECHIGPGAPWFVKAKISGVRQVFAVALKTYSKPIPSPVHDLRPARDTCEHCHWPQKFTGDKFLVRTKYADDEKNTPVDERAPAQDRRAHGRGPRRDPRPAPLGRRAHRVRVDRRPPAGHPARDLRRRRGQEGRVRLDRREADDRAARQRRAPQDGLHGLPQSADPRLRHAGPGRRQGHARGPHQREAALRQARGRRGPEGRRTPTAPRRPRRSPPRSATSTGPSTRRSSRTTAPAVETAAEKVKAIYLRNIFPEMGVTWGSHPNNIGHEDFLGCFRCHDGKHKSADGKVITDDCEACHQVLALEEEEPKILADLGLNK